MTYRVKCVECPPLPDAANQDARYEGRYSKEKFARLAKQTHDNYHHHGEDVATVVKVE